VGNVMMGRSGERPGLAGRLLEAGDRGCKRRDRARGPEPEWRAGS
jgi:hypothetical protein